MQIEDASVAEERFKTLVLGVKSVAWDGMISAAEAPMSLRILVAGRTYSPRHSIKLNASIPMIKRWLTLQIKLLGLDEQYYFMMSSFARISNREDLRWARLHILRPGAWLGDLWEHFDEFGVPQGDPFPTFGAYVLRPDGKAWLSIYELEYEMAAASNLYEQAAEL